MSFISVSIKTLSIMKNIPILYTMEPIVNSIHDGTNCAPKYNSVCIGPNIKIKKSLIKMCNNTVCTVKALIAVERKNIQS